MSRENQKISPNGELTLFLPRREVMMRTCGELEPLEGVVLISTALAQRPDIRVIVQVEFICDF